MSNTIYWNVRNLNKAFGLPDTITHIEFSEEDLEYSKNPYLTEHNINQTPQWRSAQSERMQGENNPMFGRRGSNSPHFGKSKTAQHNKKNSDAHIGDKNPFFGKTHSDELKEKWSIQRRGQNHPMFGRKHSPESREKMRQAQLRRKNNINSIEETDAISISQQNK